MASSGQRWLTVEALVGMIFAEAEPSRLPSRVWPLTAACQRLAKSKAPVDPAVLGCARSVSLIWGDRLVETWMRHLAENGFVRPSGRGMQACWEVDPVWQDGWRVIVEALDADERATFREAAQVLTTCLSIWEKTLLAASNGV
jgi:hypothetical protein